MFCLIVSVCGDGCVIVVVVYTHLQLPTGIGIIILTIGIYKHSIVSLIRLKCLRRHSHFNMIKNIPFVFFLLIECG